MPMVQLPTPDDMANRSSRLSADCRHKRQEQITSLRLDLPRAKGIAQEVKLTVFMCSSLTTIL